MIAVRQKTCNLKWSVCAALLLAVVLLSQPVVAAITQEARQSDSQLLSTQALRFMQTVNLARRDPLATAARLGIDYRTVQAAFGDDFYQLERGLPPLAWSPQLVASATKHSRDMFERLYYSYTNPEGQSFEQRILAQGYNAAFVGESMNALFFQNYVSMDVAFDWLVDSMLRDELQGNPSVDRNIFSTDISEIGVCFMAESVALLNEQPYVYLLLADFARPFRLGDKRTVIVDYDPSLELRIRVGSDPQWQYPKPLTAGLAQFDYPVETLRVVLVDEESGAMQMYYPQLNKGGSENLLLIYPPRP